jgi:iron complex transport system permease protein
MLIAALLAVLLVSLCIGRYPIGLLTIMRLLAAQIIGAAGGPDNGWTNTDLIVVTSVRLPRVLAAAAAGFGLGLSGAALQGLFRNPLVGPQVVGISNGAAWGGVLAILMAWPSAGIVAAAFIFGLLALIAVFALSRVSGGGGRDGLSIVLAGVIVSAFFAALVGVAEVVADPERELPSIVYWLLGSFATASARSAVIVGVTTLVAGSMLMCLRWRVNILSLDDADAASLGVMSDEVRWAILLLVTLIVAAQVSVSGAIGWVGLVVPHLARRLVGPDHRRLLPASALLGAIYLLAVDDVVRTASEREIPIGVLTALIGTPIFAIVFWRSRRSAWT